METLNDIYSLFLNYINQSKNNRGLDLINALGSLATAGTFIYLVVMDWKKSKKISNLERVAMVLEKDLYLRYQPHLWLNGMSIKPDNKISFDLNNKGAWCKLTKFDVLSGDLILDESNKHLPWELEQPFNENLLNDTTRRWIFCINNSGKSANDIECEINIIYEDRIGKKYSIILKAVGNKYTLSAPSIVV